MTALLSGGAIASPVQGAALPTTAGDARWLATMDDVAQHAEQLPGSGADAPVPAPGIEPVMPDALPYEDAALPFVFATGQHGTFAGESGDEMPPHDDAALPFVFANLQPGMAIESPEHAMVAAPGLERAALAAGAGLVATRQLEAGERTERASDGDARDPQGSAGADIARHAAEVLDRTRAAWADRRPDAPSAQRHERLAAMALPVGIVATDDASPLGPVPLVGGSARPSAAADAAGDFDGRRLLAVLGERLALQLQQGVQQATIRLNALRGGAVTIELRHEAGAVDVRLSSPHVDVVRQLQAIGESLRQDLGARQFHDVTVHVSTRTPPDGGGASPQRDGRTGRDDDAGPGRGLGLDDGERAARGFGLEQAFNEEGE
ncbi:hypothetical protein WL21_04815 [Burkholderia ubonensis]|uniref:flagellar hook-length control protein FliK n=1 Tax=Burkholderia ubonensis TaxID=101571 RepID=UPI00075B778D|nr:flagellar hook-length control protein FliK [Burkholderia ubonensis]KVO87705.1 hypothetical protein WJ81_15785 [Burkholderia ubonensis]KVZ57322.1 hypothetical protein WL20_23570 [Burkholderia ubonensis]KVZ73019.1 hypothetical protein WL21_04815 [Burkholderia ubonensis]